MDIEARPGGVWCASFAAMASPCEVLFHGGTRSQALTLGALARDEALRIEKKFSRYREDSVLQQINRAGGRSIAVDQETARLIDFAAQAHVLSDGLFDITTGVLRQVWTFDGSARLPSPQAVAALLHLVGFDKLQWAAPELTMPTGMALDFGGIGKEYAVDSTLRLLLEHCDLPLLVNYGGDLRTNRCAGQQPWQVGIERPGTLQDAALVLPLASGALATSGDTRRFLFANGCRYSHILDPRTGWPVPCAPRSVTVAAATCMEAGMLASFSLLQGAGARDFLQAQEVDFWCLN